MEISVDTKTLKAASDIACASKTKIVCQIHNCRYNDGFCNCMKDIVRVGGGFYAKNAKDVICEDFMLRYL